MANHKNMKDDEEFATVMATTGNKLLVVDFNATWCGPCQKMHPIFIQLAKKFPEALFVGVSTTFYWIIYQANPDYLNYKYTIVLKNSG